MQLHKNFLLLCAVCLLALSAVAQTVTDPLQQLYIRRQQLNGNFNKNYSFSQRYFLNGQASFDSTIQDFSFGDIILHNIPGTKAFWHIYFINPFVIISPMDGVVLGVKSFVRLVFCKNKTWF